MGRLLAVAVVLSACVRPDLVDCGDGTACPVGSVCDATHGGCVTQDQLDECAGIIDGTDCESAGINGGCFDDVCLERGCGNRIVEGDETCDDGNKDSGDGCRADCLSTEKCGNGVVDSGELCDDGNFISHDGCDSRCIEETPTWTELHYAPESLPVGVYDVKRKRLVMLLPNEVWEQDGQGWHHTAFTTGPADGNYVVADLYYDTDRAAVMAVADTGVWQWDGATWTLLPASVPPNIELGATLMGATYDPDNHRMVTFKLPNSRGNTLVLAFSSTGVWSQGPTISTKANYADAAYDAPRHRIVMVALDLSNAPYLHYIDGAAVQIAATPPTPAPNFKMFDGPDGAYVHSGASLVRIANAIQPVASTVNPPGAWLYYDLQNGTPASAWYSRFGRLQAPAWIDTGHAFSAPYKAIVNWDHDFIAPAQYDPSSAERVRVWTVFPTLSEGMPMDSAPTGRSRMELVNAMGRRSVIAFGGSRDATPFLDSYELTAMGWRTLPAMGAATTISPLFYDAKGRRTVAPASTAVYTLDDDKGTWEYMPAAGPSFGTFAWDARHQTFVNLAGANLFERADIASAGSLLTLAPLGVSVIVENQRSGGVFMGRFSAGAHELYERRGDDYLRYDAPPVVGSVVSATYRPRDGSTLFLSTAGKGGAAYVFELKSPTPDEGCVAGEDADGDGLAYCDDPDCYWKCSACPPYTTCRFDLTPE